MDQISHRHPDHGLLAPLPAPSVQKLQLFNQPFLSYCFISVPKWAFGEHIISDEYKTWHSCSNQLSQLKTTVGAL